MYSLNMYLLYLKAHKLCWLFDAKDFFFVENSRGTI